MADPIARALVTLQELKDELGIDASDTSSDNALVRRINAASRAAYRESGGREFKPFGTNPQWRAYEVGADTLITTDLGDIAPYRGSYDDASIVGAIVRELQVDDLTDFDQVEINGIAVSLTEITPLPRVREEWEPIEALRFSANVAGLVPGAVLRVHGNFGFPAVPEDLKDEVIENALARFERQDVAFSETFEDATSEAQRLRQQKKTAASSETWPVANSYRRAAYRAGKAYGTLAFAKRTDALTVPPIWPWQ
jgi:hypothetical protein